MKSDREILDQNAMAAYIGGSYYEPATEAQEIGRVLFRAEDLASTPEISPFDPDALDRSYFLTSLHDTLTERLRAGEIAFGIYVHAKGYAMAPYLYSAERLSDFEMQVFRGVLNRVAYVAIPQGVVGNKLTL